MLRITRATTNTLYVTCQEKQLLTSPYYLWKFVNPVTKDTRYCISSDTSGYPARYQQLTVVETTTPTVSTNQVKLDTTGTWEYYIYEQSSSTNIDPTGLTEVESGFVEVLHTATTPSTYTGYQSTFAQYNP